MDPIELIIFTIFGLGFWVIIIIVMVIIPFQSYLKGGKVWNLTADRRSYTVLKGKKGATDSNCSVNPFRWLCRFVRLYGFF